MGTRPVPTTRQASSPRARGTPAGVTDLSCHYSRSDKSLTPIHVGPREDSGIGEHRETWGCCRDTTPCVCNGAREMSTPLTSPVPGLYKTQGLEPPFITVCYSSSHYLRRRTGVQVCWSRIQFRLLLDESVTPPLFLNSESPAPHGRRLDYGAPTASATSRLRSFNRRHASREGLLRRGREPQVKSVVGHSPLNCFTSTTSLLCVLCVPTPVR